MALDLKKVVLQIKNIDNLSEGDSHVHNFNETYKLFERANNENINLIRKLIESQESLKTGFSFAVPHFKDENIGKIIPLNENINSPHIVISTDGSQINPSAHEVSPASLINIGYTGIPYFNKEIPVTLKSEPTIYASSDEISPFIDERANEEDLIAYERTLKEIEGLVILSKEYIKYNVPIIALLDGTLIHWHIEKFSPAFIESFMNRFTKAMLEFKALNIPVASYISSSRSNDTINMLRVFRCPYDSTDCKKYCSGINSKNYPCNPTINYKPVFDRRLYEKLFKDNQSSIGSRSILFKSNSKILNYYSEELKISFFYFFTGREVSRVEIPNFVANNSSLLETLQKALTLQCTVGYGYPVSLSEAHIQAVVTKNDRSLFYELIKEKCLRSASNKITLSSKELKKRISFV